MFRCLIYSIVIIVLFRMYIYIYYFINIYGPKIQCNLLVGFKRKGFMPWAFGSFVAQLLSASTKQPGL